MFFVEQQTEIQHHAHRATSLAHTLISWLGEGLRQCLLFPVLRQCASITVVGADKLTHRAHYVFACNHTSHLDAPVLLAALPLRLRMRTRVAAAADYFFTRRWHGLLVRLLLNAFPFVRKASGCQQSLDNAMQLLHAGQNVLIFPEGTRSCDGQLQPFKKGVARIALGSRACVVPVWIDGTFAALPKGAHWPRRTAIQVTFGQPLHFAESLSLSQAVAAIEQAVREVKESTHVNS